jgi:DNA-binding MarR family transcriptional regulator
MNTLNLHASDPVFVAVRAETTDLHKAIRDLDHWDQQALGMANMLITVWSARAIANPNNREGISELQRLIHYALEKAQSSASLPEEFRYRWVQASEMLESRRLNLAHADPAAQLQRRHVPDILDFLNERNSSEVGQSELEKLLDLSAGRITQLVGSLESCGLVNKRKQGREIFLELTATGQKYAELSADKTLKPATSLSQKTEHEPGFRGLLSPDKQQNVSERVRMEKIIAAA